MKSVRTFVACLGCCLPLLSRAAQTQELFTDVTEGIAGQFLPGFIPAGGIAFTDYNNDGLPDLYFAAFGGPAFRLLQNQGDGLFSDETATLRLAIPTDRRGAVRGGGSVFGDYDNDGDADFFVSAGHAIFAAPDLLLRNDGTGFTDVAAEAGLVEEAPTDNAIWFDYDRDGNLDLYIGHWLFPGFGSDPNLRNKLQHNNGDGTFTDVTVEAGLDIQLHATGGGSGHGMAAADFDNDDWPDLYVGVWNGANRLFLNDGEGGFRDATTPVIADTGKVFGVAVGDIDNDGDIDIFQAGGGRGVFDPTVPSPSFLFSNEGGGTFANISNEAGLSILYEVPPTYLSENAVTSLIDIDNDGDLDLMIGAPLLRLFINDGTGRFAEQLSGSGITTFGFFSAADYDNDGFQDLWIAGGFLSFDFGIVAGPALYRNNANENHWLQVELVGSQSNRDGIGARVIARVGDVELVRELRAGTGFTQGDKLIQLGLGPIPVVDRLEIHWPSGQISELTDIPADQRIRVLEGRDGYHRAEPTVWEADFPDTTRVGRTVSLAATVKPALFDDSAEVMAVVADLSALGGPAAVALAQTGELEYQLETSFVVGGEAGVRAAVIIVEQRTAVGPYRTVLSKSIRVLSNSPPPDLLILGDAFDLVSIPMVDSGEFDFLATSEVFAGQFSLAVTGAGSDESQPGMFSLRFELPQPLESTDFRFFRFAFHPGDAALFPPGAADAPPPGLVLVVESEQGAGFFDVLAEGLIDLDLDGWQQVEVPFSAFDVQGSITAVGLFGRLQGEFFLDDIRLVSIASEVTAVLESRSDVVPLAFALGQNYPNPFNSRTAIEYRVPSQAEVELQVYNAAGQQVATLVEDARAPGTYTLWWDGRDDAGRELASGIYIYRLRSDRHQLVRKLVLLR